MYTDIHTDFILTPIQAILEQGINAAQSLPYGIDSFPISEYHLQSLFLRMCGASEQKMKCILWQMATDDYQYRYKYLNYQGLGEFSTYASKNIVFQDLISQIVKLCPKFNPQSIWDDYEYAPETIEQERVTWINRVKVCRQKQIDHIKRKRADSGNPMSQQEVDKMTNGIMGCPFKEDDFKIHLAASKCRSRISQILEETYNMFANTNFESWRNVDLQNYHTLCQKLIRGCDIVVSNKDNFSLFSNKMVRLYDSLVYQHRNRIAHNTVSYQQNLPALETLSDKNYYQYNYFFRFAIILIVDEIFIRLYRVFLDVRKKMVN